MKFARGSTQRWSVAAGLVALMILPAIAGCGGYATAGSVAASSSIPAASPPSSSATPPSTTESLAAAPSAVPSSPAASSPIETPDYTVPPSPSGNDPGPATPALGALALLVVRDAAPQTGYRRELFGQTWSDDVTIDGGHNGCDTRNDILRRDLTGVQIKVGTHGCVVSNGTLEDPYSADTIVFVRGAATSDDVQIDHLVALSDAWRSGAQELTADERANFANDPLNLLAVSGPLNQAKGDGDAASWLPPNVAFRCAYVIRQIQVKTRYALWVVPAEHDAMARILTDCGELPASASAPPAATTVDEQAATAPIHEPAVTVPSSAGSVNFKNCAAARAAGATPLLRGQPGYRESMDGDQDGIACEN